MLPSYADLQKHNNFLSSVYDKIKSMTELEKYNFFLQEERNYVSSIRENLLTVDNFAHHIHLLNPTEYHLYHEFNFDIHLLKSMNDILLCYNCNEKYNLENKYNLHICKLDVVCDRCSAKITYEEFFLNNMINKFKLYETSDLIITIISSVSTRNSTSGPQEKLKLFSVYENILANIKEKYNKVNKKTEDTIYKIINKEYNNLSYFPFDLIKGSFRHIDFLQKFIKNINIYNTELFYKNSLKNYVKFVNLIKCFKEESVPTFAIDIIWHVHIKNHLEYRRYTLDVLGYMLNHNDNITSTHTKKTYSKTCLNWSELYGEKYSEEIPDYNCLTNSCLPNFKIMRLKKLYKNNLSKCTCTQNQVNIQQNKMYYKTNLEKELFHST
jgi:hypothetical protein